jgi:TetR/AcrR family transcriptional regulator, regulator of biofilm formation and stress response
MYMTLRDEEKPVALEGEKPERRGGTRAGERRSNGERRLLLLQTTLMLIASEGIDAVSHRSVAEAAGVPLGSTTYWFASRQEMLRQALEHFARLETETLRERLAGVLGKRLSRRRLVDEFTALLLPQLGEDRWRTVAQYALLQEAVRQPELEPVCREWTAAWEEALREVFTSLGAPSPALEARMFLAMLDGLLLGQLAAPDPNVEHTVLRPALRAWFSRVPTGPS